MGELWDLPFFHLVGCNTHHIFLLTDHPSCNKLNEDLMLMIIVHSVGGVEVRSFGAPVHFLPDPPPRQGWALKPSGGRPRLHPDFPGGTLKHENLFGPGKELLLIIYVPFHKQGVHHTNSTQSAEPQLKKVLLTDSIFNLGLHLKI